MRSPAVSFGPKTYVVRDVEVLRQRREASRSRDAGRRRDFCCGAEGQKAVALQTRCVTLGVVQPAGDCFAEIDDLLLLPAPPAFSALLSLALAPLLRLLALAARLGEPALAQLLNERLLVVESAVLGAKLGEFTLQLGAAVNLLRRVVRQSPRAARASGSCLRGRTSLAWRLRSTALAVFGRSGYTLSVRSEGGGSIATRNGQGPRYPSKL